MSDTPSAHRARLTLSPFRDRAEAGLLLGEKVRAVLGPAACDDPERSRGSAIPAQPDGSQAPCRPLRIRVFAIPRGGVAVGAGVARCLGVPLDVIVVRKIGHPQAPELGLGAIAEGADPEGTAPEGTDSGPVFDDELLAQVGLTRADLGGVVARERAELDRRMTVYHGALHHGALHHGTVPHGTVPHGTVPHGAGQSPEPGSAAAAPCDVAVVVDDGLATGVTARAALRAVRGRGVPRIVLAVPVAAQQAVEAMEEELAKGGTGEVVTLVTSRRFRSVGEWYADFGQLTDADVLTLLSSGGPA